MRWLRPTLVLLSALACVAATFAWVTSYAPPSVFVAADHGSLLISSTGASRDYLKNYGGGSTVTIYMSRQGSTYRHAFGFAYISGTSNYGSFDIVAIPFWFIVLLTGI